MPPVAIVRPATPAVRPYDRAMEPMADRPRARAIRLGSTGSSTSREVRRGGRPHHPRYETAKGATLAELAGGSTRRATGSSERWLRVAGGPPVGAGRARAGAQDDPGGELRVDYRTPTAQDVIARIRTPLTVLRIREPSLEQAYIELLRDPGEAVA